MRETDTLINAPRQKYETRESPDNDPWKNERKDFTIVKESLLNNINEKGLSNARIGKFLNKPGATNERILIERIIDVGTNDLSNGINLLNDIKKIFKQINAEEPKANIAFLSIINRKTRKKMGKYVTETNHRLRNYCKQSDIVYIDNANKNEVHLGVKKAAPKSEGNSCFAKNLLKHLSNA